MALNNSDLFLVNDGSQTTTVTFEELNKGKDSTMLNDNDLFLVNDGTKTETVTWSQMKGDAARAPVIDSVTLAEDTPETPQRFTNQSFTTTFVMADDGSPTSAKYIRAWVYGDLIGQPGTKVKRYLVLDGDMNVEYLQTDPPDFHPIDTNAPVIKFGSTLGSSSEPDLLLPEGTNIQTEIQAFNTIEPTSVMESNAVTPIKVTGPKATMHGLRFDSKGRQTYLYRDFDWSDTWTMSFWAKPTSNNYYINGWINISNANANCAHYRSNVWKWYSSGNGGESTNSSPSVDYNQWQHIVYKCDNNVISVSKNGSAWELCDGLGTAFYGDQFSCSGGAGKGNITGYDGYQSDLYFVDGRVLEPTDFGADFEGKWGPLDGEVVKTNVGNFGANGFFLPVNLEKGIGHDDSGNGNDFDFENFFFGGTRQPSTAVVTGAIQPAHPVENIFDGDLTTYTRPEGNAEAQVDMEPPYTEAELNSLRFYIWNESTDEVLDTDCFKVNGVDYSYLVTKEKKWITIPETRFDSFSMRSNGISSVPNVFQVEINNGVFGFGGRWSAGVTYQGDYFAGSAEEIFDGDPNFTKLVITQLNNSAQIKWSGQIDNVDALAVWTERQGYIEVVGNLGTVQKAYSAAGTAVKVDLSVDDLAGVGTTIYSISTNWTTGTSNQLYMYGIEINNTLLIDDYRTTDSVKDSPMTSYAVLETGANGNLESTSVTSITYLGEAGTNYYYEEDGVSKVHTGGTAFSSVSGKQYNFGQQPFINEPTPGEVWSSYGSGPMASANYSWEKAFNGGPLDKENCVMPPFDETNTWIYTGDPLGSRCAIHINKQAKNQGEFKLNGTTRSIAFTDDNGFIRVEFNEPLERIDLLRGSEPATPGQDAIRICAIEVDGEFLVDPGELEEAVGNELFQTWKQWNNVAFLYADNPEHVAKYEAIKAALESYEGDLRQYRGQLITRLVNAGFTLHELDALNLINIEEATEWAVDTGYEDGNLVTYNGEYWYALSSSYNNSPDDNDPEDWVSLTP